MTNQKAQTFRQSVIVQLNVQVGKQRHLTLTSQSQKPTGHLRNKFARNRHLD
jgi:hypothetical protein